MITFARGQMRGGQVRLTRADGGQLAAEDRFGAVLASREDFDVRIIDIPPVADREVEGLIRFRLRSTYPGNPSDTSFDFRLVGKGRKVVVFVCPKRTLEAYRSAAGRRPLLLPYVLVARWARRLHDFRAWVIGDSWAELMVFRGGLLVSSEVYPRTSAGGFDLAQAEMGLTDDVRALQQVVVAARADLDAIALEMSDGEQARRLAATEGGALSPPSAIKSPPKLLCIEDLLPSWRKKDALFSQEKRSRVLLSPLIRIAALSAAAALLALMVFYKYVGRVERTADAMEQQSAALELANRRIIAVQKEVEDISTELSLLEARRPQDLYLLLSELSAVLDGEAVIRSMTVRENGFQIEAVGRNSLQLMEGVRTRGSFSNVKLSQVVPDSGTGKERFSFSGVFDVR